MTPAKCAILEKDVKFKGFFMPKNVWGKNFIYLLAPIILLAFSAFSLKYIFDAGKLASLITIPYLIVFMLSITLLKLSKNYVVKKEVSKDGLYLVCLAKTIKEDDKNVYLIFSTGEHRHEKYYLEKYAKQLSDADVPLLTSKDEAFLLDSETELYAKVFTRKKLIEKRVDFGEDSLTPLVYVDNKHISLIPSKILRK